jgi:hypothetical protein
MSNNETNYRISQLRHRYILIRSLEVLFFFIATVFVMLGVFYLLDTTSVVKAVLSIGVGIVVLVERIFRYKLIHLTDAILVRHLNNHYPILEHSADLLLRDSASLSGLQIIQQQKISKQFESMYPEIKIPNLLPQSVGALILGLSHPDFICSPDGLYPRINAYQSCSRAC